jgi:TrmH family RNA methyltransferase
MPPFLPLSAAKAGLIRQLSRQKKVRDAERAFVLEGVKPIRDVFDDDGGTVLAVVIAERYLKAADPTFRLTLERHAAPVYTCRDMVFDKLSELSTSPGILAVIRQPIWNQEAVFKQPRVFGFYGEDLQDPANVGAVIRTAGAFGMDGLWLSSDSADVFNPKVVRAAAGVLLKLPVFSVRDIDIFARHRCDLLTAELPGPASQAIQDIRHISSRTIIALGNESRGLSETTLKQATVRFHIPISPAMDSLNIAASAAIAAFYFSNVPRKE